MVVVLVAVGAFGLNGLALQQCSISAPTSTNTRLINITLSGCSDTNYFSVSEDASFGKSKGPEVSITNVAADDSYADLSITYPSGSSTEAAVPFSLPSNTKDIKVLTVLFVFDDDTGSSANLAPYVTTKWANRLVYGDSTGIGPDGYFKNQSLRDYLWQSTYGRVNLTGEVYPTIVHLSLEKYRKLREENATVAYDADLLRAIQAERPAYLDTKNFDMLLALSPDVYSVDRTNYQHALPEVANGNFGTIRQSLTYGLLPVDENNSILAKSITETRTASDAQTVVTRYNPRSVKGVWLESDTRRTGKNYYAGGSLNISTNTRFTKIVLGTALPSADSRVIVEYDAAVAGKEGSLGKDWVIESSWYPHLTHEFMHDVSDTAKYSYNERTHLGDLYKPPAKVDSFDLMASGNEYAKHPSYTPYTYYEPSLLSAPNKTMFGQVNPFTVPHNKSSTSVRIYRSEFGSLAAAARTSVIKVPLRPTSELGLAARTDYFGDRQYKGQEYLLLEWRSKRDNLENNMHNFDRNLTSSGLVIYHVIESEPYALTGHGSDVVRVIDATPPVANFSDSYSDTATSPATFGPESGIMTYRAGDFWQSKSPVTETLSVGHLLSEGAGQKTLYIKFADANGVVSSVKQVTTNLSTNESNTSRLPELALNLIEDTEINAFKVVTANYTAPNGAKNIRFYIDGDQVAERVESVISQTSSTVSIRPSDFKPGSHILKAVLYDGAMNRVTKTVNFTIGAGGDSTAPDVSIVSPAGGATVSNTIDVQASVTDNNNVAKVEFYIDGIVRLVDSTSPYSYSWDTTGTTNGVHSVKVVGYDKAGNSATAQRSIQVGNTDTTPPTVPSGLTAKLIDDTTAQLQWASSSDSGSIVSYDIYRNGNKVTTTTEINYDDFGLSTARTYRYYVIARDDSGNQSTQSDTAVINTAPLQVTGLSQTASTSSEISLKWNINPDADNNVSYIVFRNDTKISTTAETKFKDTGLKAGTTYVYHIVAKSSAGSLATKSDLISATTQATKPAGKINGRVTRPNGKRLNNVKLTIKVSGKLKTYRTNKSGWFVMKDIPVGKHSIKLSKPGFKTRTVNLSVYANKTTTKNVTLFLK